MRTNLEHNNDRNATEKKKKLNCVQTNGQRNFKLAPDRKTYRSAGALFWHWLIAVDYAIDAIHRHTRRLVSMHFTTYLSQAMSART